MGQNLYATKLAPASELPALKLLLNEADPPTRMDIISRMSNAMGLENVFEHVSSVGKSVGSGSANYGVRVKFKVLNDRSKNPKTVDAIVRIQREGIKAEVKDEGRLINGMLESLRDHPDRKVRKAAAKASEAWEGASKSLLKTEQELDLSIERDLYKQVNQVYSRSSLTTKSGYPIEAVKPLDDYQKLIKEEYGTMVSVYEYIPNTDLDKIKDVKLRSAMAEDVINTELDAIFKGTFDKDGHEKNWLFDTENKRIVRIDYAQFQTIPKEEIQQFQQALKPFARPKPAANDAQKNARRHECIF